MKVNEQLRDRAVDRAVDLDRYSRGAVLRMIAVLNRSDVRLTAQLAEALTRIEPSQFTIERLDALLGSVRQTNARAYAQVMAELEPEMRGLAQAEAGYQTATLRQTLPAPVQVAFPLAVVTGEQVYAAALARPFQGRLLADWAANVEASRMTLIRNAVRQGFVEGRTTDVIIRDIRGTKVKGYADGLLNRPRRELATIVQTALSHTAQVARAQIREANSDIIKAVQWVSTLDTKTTEECQIRDGLRYTPDDFEPIGHSVPWGDGPGRLHFNCRSTDVPITKSWRELGLDVDDAPASTRASMDGQVAGDMSFGDWLLKQSPERQDEALGPVRGQMLRDGKMQLPDFYDGKGQPLSLEELRAKSG